MSVSWLETSSRARGIRLGTAASLAGIQISVIVSMRNVATAAQPTTRPPLTPESATSGIEANRTNRNRSQMTMV